MDCLRFYYTSNLLSIYWVGGVPQVSPLRVVFKADGVGRERWGHQGSRCQQARKEKQPFNNHNHPFVRSYPTDNKRGYPLVPPEQKK